jgi:RNA polymerase sigma-70 factor (ECF subfamily)
VEDSEARERFRELYAACYRKLLAYAYQRTSNREDAHEVVADTFLVAWRRLEDVIAADSPLAWLYGVAHRVLANQRRRRGRQERLIQKLANRGEVVRSDSASREIEGHRLLSEVSRIIDELPPRYREVLRLTAFQDLTPAQIALALDMPSGAVRTLLYRARLRLKKALDQRYPGWELVTKDPE